MMKTVYLSMNTSSRRDFLKTTGLGAVGLSALPSITTWGAVEIDPTFIPPHRPLTVPGLHAYPLEHSLVFGELLNLCVSSDVPYRLSICRLGPAIDDPSGDEVLVEYAEASARPFPIHPGSYAHIEENLTRLSGALTLQCWVRPWTDRAYAGLVTQYDYKDACGIGLFLGPEGKAIFYLGDGGVYHPDRAILSPAGAIVPGRWIHIVGTWDGHEAFLWMDGQRVSQAIMAGPVEPGKAPLRLGAYGEAGVASKFLDGDLARPTILGRALPESEIAAQFQDQGLIIPDGEDVLACWPLDEESGDRVADSSAYGRNGRIINHATWMIGGPSFDPDVPRFGDYAPEEDARRGHGLRFASDDLYDCRWPVAHQWRVPAEAKSGLYVARFQFEIDGTPREYHCTFLVRRSPDRPKAPILVLAATNTWRAYSGTPFAPTPEARMQVWGTGGLGGSAPGLPSFNLYRQHVAGQGTYQMGLRMPWPAAGPYVLYGEPTRYSHLMRADRFALAWLESNGYQYDLISDLDLHRDPSILQGYQTFLINGHSEYWSLSMCRGLKEYLHSDGKVIVLSGNSLFWRVSFNDDGTIMECRKADAPGTQVPADRRGETWHSQDRQRGGLLRECGHPGWRLIGLETLGWNNQGNPKNFGPYVVEQVDHPFFHEPEETGLQAGDRFGWAGEGQMPMANGHEFDVRLSTLASLQEVASPEGSEVPTDPAGMVRLANGIIPWSEGGSAFDYFFRPIQPKSDQGGEIIDWQRPEGGRVFNAGSIGSGWALHADPRWAALVRNALHQFGVPRPRG
ncbi:hypothetical protein BH23PLA1_BH23PLA1_13450 [soil metagenome]